MANKTMVDIAEAKKLAFIAIILSSIAIVLSIGVLVLKFF